MDPHDQQMRVGPKGLVAMFGLGLIWCLYYAMLHSGQKQQNKRVLQWPPKGIIIL